MMHFIRFSSSVNVTFYNEKSILLLLQLFNYHLHIDSDKPIKLKQTIMNSNTHSIKWLPGDAYDELKRKRECSSITRYQAAFINRCVWGILRNLKLNHEFELDAHGLVYVKVILKMWCKFKKNLMTFRLYLCMKTLVYSYYERFRCFACAWSIFRWRSKIEMKRKQKRKLLASGSDLSVHLSAQCPMPISKKTSLFKSVLREMLTQLPLSFSQRRK